MIDLITCCNPNVYRLHGGVVLSTVTSQCESSWFESWLGPFCVEFACSIWSLWLPPTTNVNVSFKQYYSKFLHLKPCASDLFSSTLTAIMPNFRPETAIKPPGAEIPQFMMLLKWSIKY